MSLEILEKLANESGNEEFVNAVKGVKDSYKSNLDRMNYLEKDMQKAVEKRDALKNLVKSKTGLEEINEDSFNNFLSSKTSNDGEIKNLTSVIESLKTEKDSLFTKLQSIESGYRFEKSLNAIGAIEEAENSKAYEIILAEIKRNSVIDENGQILFKDKDGITLRNSDGSPLSLSDRYNNLKESSEFSFLFKTKRSKAGSGASSSNVPNIPKKLDINASKEDRISAIRSKFNL